MSRQPLTEHEDEVVPGIPGRLPDGETLLWQGSPKTWAMIRSLHVRGLSVYFAAMIAVRAVTAWNGDVVDLGRTMAPLMGVAAAAVALLCIFGWLVARTTIYSVTDQRVVLRYGVALSKAVNIPFRLIVSAGLRLNADGTGDIPLRLQKGENVPFLMVWPHARPWKTSPAQPMLRATPDAALVAQRLSRALAQATGGQVEAIAQQQLAPERVRGLPPDGAVTA